MVASRTACVENLAARRAVKAVEGRIIGIDGGAARSQTSEDAGGGVKGAYGGTWCIRGGSGRSPIRSRKPYPVR